MIGVANRLREDDAGCPDVRFREIHHPVDPLAHVGGALPPPRLAVGIKGLICVHSASVRSLAVTVVAVAVLRLPHYCN